MRLYRNRLATVLAMLAMALQALWPLVAQAKPRTPGELVPICTVEGITHYLELPAQKSPLDDSATHDEHCKLCVFGCDRSVALPTVDAIAIAVFHVVAEHPGLQSAPHPELLNHPPAQPRAPPSLS